MEEKPVRILLVDDQVLYREAVRGLIDRWHEFDVVAEASDGEEAVQLALRLNVDLVLMDVRMPKMDGVEAVRAILRKKPDLDIVMLTVESDKEALFDALQAGARGYLLKDTPARKLRDRLRGVTQGKMVLSASVTEPVVEEFTRLRESAGPRDVSRSAGEDVPSPEHLSDREKDILRLVAQGKSNEEIAAELYLSLGTVKKQLSALMLRLCLENRVQAAVYAVKAGLDK